MKGKYDPESTKLDELLIALKREHREKLKELQDLKERILKLERASQAIAHELGPEYAGAVMEQALRVSTEMHSWTAPRTTLRSAVVDVLRHRGAKTPDTSMSAKEVADVLDRRRGTSDRRAFYAQVYVVLMRASQPRRAVHGKENKPEELGPVSVEVTGKGRRFYLT